jgi:hypothetical protein
MTPLPEGWTQEHQGHLEAMMAARLEEDAHIRWLVSAELRTFLPSYVQAEEEAAAAVKIAFEALRQPESDLAAMDKQIGEVTGECGTWERKLGDSSAALRVEAHARFAGWSHELDVLHAERAELDAEAEVLRDAWKVAVAELRHASTERAALETNIEDFPYWGLGSATDAYQVWRANAGHLVPLLLRGEEGVQEWDAAIAWMDDLCLRSGYRTDHLPTYAERYREAMRNHLAATDSTQPAPSAGEVMRGTEAYARSQARVPSDNWEYVPHVNPLRASPDPAKVYQPLRNIR